jgi:hypothetical protein
MRNGSRRFALGTESTIEGGEPFFEMTKTQWDRMVEAGLTTQHLVPRPDNLH